MVALVVMLNQEILGLVLPCMNSKKKLALHHGVAIFSWDINATLKRAYSR